MFPPSVVNSGGEQSFCMALVYFECRSRRSSKMRGECGACGIERGGVYFWRTTVYFQDSGLFLKDSGLFTTPVCV